MASIALNKDDHVRSDEEAWQELQEERRAMIQALKNNDLEGERKAEELTQRLKRTLFAKGDDINQDVHSSLDRLDSSINQLQESITTEDDFLTEFGEIEPVWERVNKYIEYLYNQKPDPEHVFEGTNGAYPNDLRLPDGAKRYNVKDMQIDLRDLFQKHLNPMVQALENGEVGSQDPLGQLSDVVKETVRAHQYLNEYKHILKIALEDEELRRRIAAENGLQDLQGEISSQEEDLQRFNQRLEEVEQSERRVLERIEEAHEILDKKTSIDEQVIEEIADEFMPQEESSSGFLSRITGSGGSPMASEKFEEITMHYEGLLNDTEASGIDVLTERFNESEEEAREDLDELEQVADIMERSTAIIEQSIMPAVERLREAEELDDKLNRRLVEELDEYLDEHRHLFDESESAEELREEAISDAEQDERQLEEQGVGEVFQGIELEHLNVSAVEAFNERIEGGGGPPGSPEDPRWKIFHEHLMELLEMSDRGKFEEIEEELESLLDQYENVYREEGDEQKVIEDMEQKTKDLKNNIEEVLADVQELGEADREALRESNTWREDTAEIKEDMASIQEGLNYLYRDILRTEEFNEKESSDFTVLQEEIESVFEDVSGIKQVLSEDLAAVVDRLKDEDIGRGAGEYADALMLSAMERYGESRPHDRLKERLLQEVRDVNQKLSNIGEMEEKLRQKDHREVEVEEKELEEMYSVLETIKGKNGAYTELKEELNPRGVENLDKHMDGEVANIFTEIKNRMNKIVELLQESIEDEKIVVQEAEQDEAELKNAEEATKEGFQFAFNLEETIEEHLEEQSYKVGEIMDQSDTAGEEPRCPVCGNFFKQEGTFEDSLREHLGNHCPDKPPEKDVSEVIARVYRDQVEDKHGFDPGSFDAN